MSGALIEKVVALLAYNAVNPNNTATAEAILAVIREELQEPSEAMETAYFEAHSKAETVFADFKDSWRAALAASPLGDA